MRLDFLFPCIDVVLHLAGEDLAKFGVDTGDVGGQRFNKSREDEEKNGEGRHMRRLFPARVIPFPPFPPPAVGPTLFRAGSDSERSMRPWGRPRWARKRRSRRAIWPASDSRSYPPRGNKSWR